MKVLLNFAFLKVHGLRLVRPASQAELDRIDAVAPQSVAAGDRYANMSTVNRWCDVG